MTSERVEVQNLDNLNMMAHNLEQFGANSGYMEKVCESIV